MSQTAAPNFTWIPQAEPIAREAGARIAEFFAQGVETEYKGDVDLVTVPPTAPAKSSSASA